MKHIAEKFFPHLLKNDQKQNQMPCARDSKNRPKRKETSILSSGQEMKAGFMVMTQDKATVIPVEVILLPCKRVEAEEVILQEHVVCFLEQ